MLLRMIQFSDLHIDENSSKKLNVNTISSAISTLKTADSYMIISNGDIAFSGKKVQYEYYSKFIKGFFKTGILKRTHNHIEFLCVPGNHDIDYSIGTLPENDVAFKDKYGRSIRSSKIECIDKIVSDYTKAQCEFYAYAKKSQCAWNDNIVSKKVINLDNFQIGFVMVNSSVFSLMKGENADKGCHQLVDADIAKIQAATTARYNVLILHHGLEWFTDSTKKQLREIISEKYVIVLTGHEHEEIAENKVINNSEPCLYVQANAFNDPSVPDNGFCTIDIDTETHKISVKSFVKHSDIYVHTEVCNASLQKYSVNGIRNTKEYLDFLKVDQNGICYDNYYFPTVEYTQFDEKNKPVKHVIKKENELYDFVTGKGKISISGDSKCGKTILAKRMYFYFIEHGFVPIMFDTEIHHMKKERIVKNVFGNQFFTENDAFERFKQLSPEKKVAIIDDADLIKPTSFKELLDILGDSFGTIVILHKSETPTDIHKQVLDAIDNELKLTINPFWYSSRKGLITNLLVAQKVPEERIPNEVKQINDLINGQIKYFNLNPEFIINFVKLYEQDVRFQFTAGKEAFSMVYENSIKNRIIVNCKEGSPEKYFTVLQEMAYYMHFNKKKNISLGELCACIDKYKREFRQDINYISFVETTKNAEIITEHNNQFAFRDRTYLAYFVARAISSKAGYQTDPEYEDVMKNFKYILDNLCFGINSDIVLFLSVVTNSPIFVNIIIEKATEFFEGKEELSFLKDNVSFVSNTCLQIKESLPSTDDKVRREEQMSESEKQIKTSDEIETINEYDYTEEDLLIFANQIQKAFKYLEILSKVLPAFCSSIRCEHQDRLVDLVYRSPNKFLFMILNSINENFDKFIEDLHQDALNKGKEIKKETIKTFTEQISAMLIIAVYNLVATMNTTADTITALNAFACKEDNSNYDILNLMFNAKLCDVKTLLKIAVDADKKYNKPIEKSIIKFAVRDYYMRNDVNPHGDGAALADYFFGQKGRNFFGQNDNQVLRENIVRKAAKKD